MEELCEDEGCPHHGTPHVCNPSTVQRKGCEGCNATGIKFGGWCEECFGTGVVVRNSAHPVTADRFSR